MARSASVPCCAARTAPRSLRELFVGTAGEPPSPAELRVAPLLDGCRSPLRAFRLPPLAWRRPLAAFELGCVGCPVSVPFGRADSEVRPHHFRLKARDPPWTPSGTCSTATPSSTSGDLCSPALHDAPAAGGAELLRRRHGPASPAGSASSAGSSGGGESEEAAPRARSREEALPEQVRGQEHGGSRQVGEAVPQPRGQERGSCQALPQAECLGGCWKVGAKIGSGSYGSVHRVLHTATGRIAAVKRSLFEESCPESCKYRDRLQDELDICKTLRHPHIVSYLGCEFVDGHLSVYLEYVAGGSLAAVLHEFGPLEPTLFRKAASGILQGLDYLHTRSPPVVHRDVKAANVLVSLDFCVKLTDFGCSKRDCVTKSFTTIGSAPWMAPEVIQQQDGHGRKADIWSLGCTLIEMATAARPWGNGRFDNIVAAMLHIGMSDATPPVPESLPDGARDLIGLCLRRNPADRPWAIDLLGHPFLQATSVCLGRRRSVTWSQ